MNRSSVLSHPRLAGQVRRYHTWPVLHQQTVGEHSWQILRIYWQVFGPPPPEVTTYILWHDAGELVVGDPPFPVKAHSPILKAEYDRLEHMAVLTMGGPDLDAVVEALSYWRARIKAADLLEMAEFGAHELALGNTYGRPIVDDTLEAVRRIPLTIEDRMSVDRYVSSVGLGDAACV
jgi:hypothetical protein